VPRAQRASPAPVAVSEREKFVSITYCYALQQEDRARTGSRVSSESSNSLS
jgi:hypothetical protein